MLRIVTHFPLAAMEVMMEETFGPVVGIQKVVFFSTLPRVLILKAFIRQVSSDEEALKLMNDSPYGLTASVWTNAEKNPDSQEAFLNLIDELQTGTVFLNRYASLLCCGISDNLLTTHAYPTPDSCDFLDPALAWTGVKNSGRGISLSKFGTLNDCRRELASGRSQGLLIQVTTSSRGRSRCT